MSNSCYGKICPYCKSPLQKGDKTVVCSICGIPHHLSCWQENQGCTTLGCTGSIKELIGDDNPSEYYSGKTNKGPIVQPAGWVQGNFEIMAEDATLIIQQDSPVAIEKTVLVIEHAQDRVFLRCHFRCISREAIKAILVDVHCADVWGNELKGVDGFQFLDLRTKYDTVFGQTIPIPLPDRATRCVETRIKKVLFVDGGIFECGEQVNIIPKPVTLEDYFGSGEISEQYRRETSERSRYVIMDGGAYWRCSCGAINQSASEQCAACNCFKEQLQYLLSDDALKERTAEYIKEKKEVEERKRRRKEEQERLREERLQKEREKKQAEIIEEKKKLKRKRRRKIAIFAAALIILLTAAAAGITVFWGIPYYHYREACNLYEDGKYVEAYEAFIELEDFNDSEWHAKESKYQQGLALISNKSFDEAKTVFEELGDYGDSKEQIKEADYQHALSLMAAENYARATEVLKKLGTYKESKAQLNEAMYGYVSLHKNNNNKTTYDFLTELKKVRYKDSDSIYQKLYKWKITAVVNSSESDEVTHRSVLSVSDPVYVHFTLKGGPPEGRTQINYKIRYSNGLTESDKVSDSMGDGYTGKLWWKSSVGVSGQIKIEFSDSYGNTIGNCTFYLM